MGQTLSRSAVGQEWMVSSIALWLWVSGVLGSRRMQNASPGKEHFHALWIFSPRVYTWTKSYSEPAMSVLVTGNNIKFLNKKTLEFPCYIPCEIKWKCKFRWNERSSRQPVSQRLKLQKAIKYKNKNSISPSTFKRLELEIITGSAARSSTGSSNGSAGKDSTGSATGRSTGSATRRSAGSVTRIVTGKGTGSTSRIRLHSGKELGLVLCLDANMAQKKSCAPTRYPWHIPDAQNDKIFNQQV